ncbi:MAG: hypothetical protein AAFY90_06150 [Pseudomonadota bacterium]
MDYSGNYGEMIQSLRQNPYVDETLPGWFSGIDLAVDVAAVPPTSDEAACVFFFAPKEGVQRALKRVNNFILTVDPSAYQNHEGSYKFVSLARSFSLLVQEDAGSGGVFLNLIED